jgi:hypothetical protein
VTTAAILLWNRLPHHVPIFSRNWYIFSELNPNSIRMAKSINEKLKKEWDVYAAPCQIILSKNGLIKHNFEMYGQTWWHGHKYNTVNEWDFRSFVENGKTKIKTAAKSCKGIRLTCTERQIKKALQLDYARRIGFDVTRSDYQRFYLL